MKLRIKGNSLRLRLSQSDMKRFVQEGLLEETIYFTPSKDARFTYALQHASAAEGLQVLYKPQHVIVLVPFQEVKRWAETDEVGIYGSVESSHGPLEVLLEKDFACLDATEEENADAYPNPNLNC